MPRFIDNKATLNTGCPALVPNTQETSASAVKLGHNTQLSNRLSQTGTTAPHGSPRTTPGKDGTRTIEIIWFLMRINATFKKLQAERQSVKSDYENISLTSLPNIVLKRGKTEAGAALRCPGRRHKTGEAGQG